MEVFRTSRRERVQRAKAGDRHMAEGKRGLNVMMPEMKGEGWKYIGGIRRQMIAGKQLHGVASNHSSSALMPNHRFAYLVSLSDVIHQELR